MSPLTPTLPQTQTLIPAGSFAHLPNFATKVQEALDLVNPSDKEVVNQKKQEIEQQKAHLTSLIEDLKFSQKEYDFFDYEERLLLSDAEIENILENEIFRKDGELTELGKSFYEYLEILTEGKSKELKGKMKRKLMKEFGLEDRVYESGKSLIIGKISYKSILTFTDKKQFFQDIKDAGPSGQNGLRLANKKVSSNLTKSDYMVMAEASGASGIKSIIFGLDMELSNSFTPGDFETFVQKAGDSGIRTLGFLNNQFKNLHDIEEYLPFIKKAGLAGIRKLDLSSNHLANDFSIDDFILLVNEAGKSGMRSLKLSANDFLENFNTSQLINLIDSAGVMGIRVFDISYNKLGNIIDDTIDRQILDIAKQYNMKIDYSK